MERLDLKRLSRNTRTAFADVADDAPLPGEGAVLVSLERLTAEGDGLLDRVDPVGVRLPADATVEDVAPYLDRLSLIAIEIPAFSDGRIFSLAARLRTQADFTGEIRAVGHVMADHAEFLARCGVDSVETDRGEVVDSILRRMNTYSVWYQDAVDARPTVLELRHGRTRERLAS